MKQVSLIGTTCVLALLAVPAGAIAGGEKFQMPAAKHQEQVIEGKVESDTSATAAGQTVEDMPATKHQRQLLDEQTAGGASQQTTADESKMPASKHQEQVIEGKVEGGAFATAKGKTEKGMPATKHQEKVLEEAPHDTSQGSGQGQKPDSD